MLADIKPTFGECAVLAGKAVTVNRGQLFPDPHSNTTFCVATQSPFERNGELFPHFAHIEFI